MEKPLVVKDVQQWDNPIEFLMTCVGFAVGLGNVWRFPYLCFQNGGSAFVLAFSIMLILIGLPLFFLELTISQYSKSGPLEVWKISPLFRGLGICSVMATVYVCLYYNVIICYCLIYLCASFLPNLPWINCEGWWNTADCFHGNITNIHDVVKLESPSQQFFYNYVLEMSDGIEHPIGMNYKLAASLAICWFLAFLALCKGIQTLGKVSYVTAIFPYIMIFALIIRGVTLPGAWKGIVFYIGSMDMTKLLTFKTWIDAASQVYFCLSIAQGGLITLGSHNSFKYNHEKTSIFIVLLDGFTGLLAGLAIFSVLGFMSDKTDIPVGELAVGGPGLSFIVYPEALSLMPFPWVWCIFFFLMMITIGFGSLLSLAECALSSLIFLLDIKTRKAQLMLRAATCTVFCAVGLSMTTKGGYYLLNIIETYSCTLPIILLATLESVCLCWCYGPDRINEDIKLMLGKKLSPFWIITFKYFTPTLAILIAIIAVVSNTEVVLGDYRYPTWAHSIGYAIIFSIMSPGVYFASLTLWKNGISEVLKKSITPQDDWQPAFDRVASDEEEPSNLTVVNNSEQTENDNPAFVETTTDGTRF